VYIASIYIRLRRQVIESEVSVLTMENTTLFSDDWNNATTSSSQNDVQTHVATIRHLSLKIIYIIIGTVGVLDNLFVILVFVLCIKITDKVQALLIPYLVLGYNINLLVTALWGSGAEPLVGGLEGYAPETKSFLSIFIQNVAKS